MNSVTSESEKERELDVILADNDEGLGYYGSETENQKGVLMKEIVKRSESSNVMRYLGCVCSPFIGLLNFMSLIFQSCCLVVIFIIVLVFGIVVLSEVNSISSSEKKNDDTTLLSNTYSLLKDVAYSVGYQVKPASQPPTLIVQITIDQFRADEIMKFRKRFIKNGGFDRLFKKGTFYRNGHYRHGRCVTPVGHSTLFTGGVGYSNGIIAHSFFDPNLGRVVSATENLNYTETGGKENITNSAPSYLTSTTTGDELRLFTNKSKVFSISEKDYVAIIQAGHLGKSFWWSTNSGNFISSTYFYDQYPSYVTEWNEKKLPDSYEDQFWELTYPQHMYHYQNRKYVDPGWNLGKNFPKPLHNDDKHDFYSTLLQTPIGDRIMWDFVKTVIEEEQLGKRKDEERGDGDIIDLLALSFSALDKIGHANGPNTLEYEDTVYKLDVLMKDILDDLDGYIGLENVFFALSSDHGVDIAWRRAYDLRFGNAKLFYTNQVIVELEEYLNETIFENKLTSPVILGFPHANLYFHKDVILSHGKTVDEVSEFTARHLEQNYPQILFAFTSKNIREGRVPKTLIGDSAMLSFHPQRSGDIVIFVNEHVYLADRVYPGASQHGTPWSYDSFVPMLFMGKDVPENLVVDRRVTPEDVAPTITSYFGINAPSGCTGDPLIEVLKNHDVNPFEN